MTQRLIETIAAVVVIALIALGFLNAERVRTLFEYISATTAPSAQRSFAYGERHFSATDPAAYDITQAEYFFRRALLEDPGLPYIHHELARIAFLHGDFKSALALIDVQVARHGDATPNSYYVRGLIEGYMGNYADAERDYAHFIGTDPTNWAALNDYTWVLLKDQKYTAALAVTTQGLVMYPDNPWLLNSSAIALFELGKYEEAQAIATRAVAMAARVEPSQWLVAYPGNDPRDAPSGVDALRKDTLQNMHLIEEAMASSTVQ